MDEKSPVQALERAQPVLPMGLGYVEGVTHGYIHRGTATPCAALDVANGTVITQCKAPPEPRVLAFLRYLEAGVPEGLWR
ncbi:MAG: hypothetical protein ACYDDA_02150 [Acidiferrobacteraceae bacterium]